MSSHGFLADHDVWEGREEEEDDKGVKEEEEEEEGEGWESSRAAEEIT